MTAPSAELLTAPPDPDHDYGADAHAAAAAHLEACYTALYAEDEAFGTGHAPEHLPVSPAIAPFDACDTCQIREILHAAWPWLRLAALAGAPA